MSAMSVEDYFSEVYRIIRENFRSNDPTGGMAVASAAHIVKRTLERDQTVFGFAKFKDVLQVLEKRGLLKTGLDSKNAYAVWLTEGAPEGLERRIQLPERFRPLRNQVWFAFIAEGLAGRRLLNRKTGEVLVGATDRPPDEEDWVEITAVDSRQEQENARKFLSDKGIQDSTVLAAVNSERWYRDFPKALAAQHPSLAWEWKRERSHRVIQTAQAWCERYGVDENLLFERVPAAAPVEAVGRLEPAEVDLRRLLLAAIQRMSTDELLRLHLRAQCLVAAIRPELLD